MSEAMQPETLVSPNPLEETPSPITRPVSALIEPFGEQLDRWRAKKDLSTQERYKAATSLIASFHAAVGSELKQLRHQHQREIEKQTRRYWKHRLQADASSATLFTSQEDDDDDESALEELSQYQAEYDTWGLFQDLIAVRYPEATLAAPDDSLSEMLNNASDNFAADGEPFEQYVLHNIEARERRVICKWLEGSARNSDRSLDVLETELEDWSKHGKALWSTSWQDTRERIKAEKRLRTYNTTVDPLPSIRGSDGNLIVQQLDPDATIRLKRSVDAKDVAFELAFWRLCLEKMRRGASTDEISSLCEECNQSATAVLLGTAYGQQADMDDESHILARYRWRRVCAAAAAHDDRTVNVFQAAVLGLLGGDASAVESTCADWKDLCYALLNAQLIGGYQRHVKQSVADLLPPDHLHAIGGRNVPDVDTSLEDTVNKVVNDRNVRAKTSTHSSLSTIQMALISNNLLQTLVDQGNLIAATATTVAADSATNLIMPDQRTSSTTVKGLKALYRDATALRILAHMFLILNYLDDNQDTEAEQPIWQLSAQNVCAAYIHHLFENGKLLLIPLYACNLSENFAGHVLAKTMSVIRTDPEREQCIARMEECGIDAYAVLARHTQYTLRDLRDSSSSLSTADAPRLRLLEPTSDSMWPGKRIKLPDEVDPNIQEDAAIASGQWYLFTPGHWVETFAALLDIAENFLLLGKHAVAVIFAQEVKLEDVIDAQSPTDRSDPVDNEQELSLRPKQASMYRQCSQLALAISALWEWRLAEDRGLQDQRFRSQAADVIDNLKRRMDPVLATDFLSFSSRDAQTFFPGTDADAQFKEHSQRLQTIREAHLPEVIVAYNSALQCAGRLVSRDNFIESLELGRAISGNDELIRCFQKAQRMRELVDALALTSKEMLVVNETRGHNSKQRGKTSKTLGIWDIRA